MRKMNNLLSILAVLALSGTASAALAQAPAQPNAALCNVCGLSLQHWRYAPRK